MKTLTILAILIPVTALAGTAFLRHETVRGLVKICYYDYLGSTVTINISAAAVCPVTIEVDRNGNRIYRHSLP